MMPDNANTQWTTHDYIGLSAFMHFTNKFLYQKCSDNSMCVYLVCVCVCVVYVCVLKY